LPVELILAVLQRESGGHAGEVNPKSGASGLMQVMPIALKDYNQRNGTAHTMADMRGKDNASGRKQIEVGIGVLAHFWKSAYKYLSKRYGASPVPIDELAIIADLFFAAGPGATQSKLNPLNPPTWAAVQAAYPTWNALPHPRHVLKEPKPWNLSAIQAWLDTPSKKK
jgi:soluble lytic murein transglycosylase-like protein